MKENKKGHAILRDPKMWDSALLKDNNWWGDTYRMVKEGYRAFYNARGLETYGHYDIDANIKCAIIKMKKEGRYTERNVKKLMDKAIKEKMQD